MNARQIASGARPYRLRRRPAVNARTLTEALGGKWHGSYGFTSCPLPKHGKGQGDKNPSLKIWDGPTGPCVECLSGCDWRDVRDEFRRRQLLENEGNNSDRIYRSDCSDKSDTHQRYVSADNRNHEVALAIWNECRPAEYSLVETYLRSRSITIMPPTSLRFHPNLKHYPTGLHLPCMVAAVQGPNGKITAIHRSYLDLEGKKAPISQNKMMLGPCRGGAMRFAKTAKTLVIAEGIETALSYMQTNRRPTWAALSTAGVRAVQLPAIVRHVIIAADRDENGVGLEAARAAAERFAVEGRKTDIILPKAPFTDFNDILCNQSEAP